MNLVGKAQTELLFANFNQDFTCLSVGTTTGFKLYNCDPFGKYFYKEIGSIGITEMLFQSALVALVGAGVQSALSPRSLQIINTKRDTKVCDLNFKTTILAVKMNRKRLVVVLEDRINIYDITIMKHLHLVETPPNPTGLVALSPNPDNNYLAYQPSSVSGDVLVFDCLNLQAVTIIQAHKTPLNRLAFDESGTRLATASSKGTVIRVFAMPGGELLHQFRRGAYAALIYSLAFNLEATMLAVSSDTNTVHIFKLDQNGANNNNNNNNNNNVNNKLSAAPSTTATTTTTTTSSNPGYGTIANLSTSLSSWIVPQVISDVWYPKREFAFLKIPTQLIGQVTLVGFGHQSPLIMVLTGDGSFYQYSMAREGGECVLLKAYSVLDTVEERV